MADELPVRVCPGCGQTDDHPRMIVVGGPDHPELPYHYDCVPHYLRGDHPSPAYEACESGMRGQAVREVVLNHVLLEGVTLA